METIRTENRDGVAVVTLNRGTTNAINRQLVDELTDTLRQLKNDTQVRGAVLVSSNEKFFSIGLDIPQLFELSRDDFGAFYRAFNRLCIDLYTLPKPLVAAITGHATAGGCILALCCDYRFIAQGRKLMGMNEIKLGVPVPYPIDCIFRQLVGVRIAREVVDSGEFYPPDELIGMGMVDQVLPIEQVLPRSIDKVRLLGSYRQEAFEMIKRNRTETVEAEILERLKEREEFFIECWYSDEVRRRLKEAMEKF
ncbi:MAG: enoyl-CoA hydratase/isomerase family protein [Candidatus Zixiibacteriota bacterium]